MEARRSNGCLLTIVGLLLLVGSTGAQSTKRGNYEKAGGESSQATRPATIATATGTGTTGHLVLWGPSSNLENSSITEDKFGNLTLNGTIKFLDGSVQGTAGLASVSHDLSLQGSGSAMDPLSVAVPLNLTGTSTDPILDITSTADGGSGVFVHGGRASTANGTFPSEGGDGIESFGGECETQNCLGGRGGIFGGGTAKHNGAGGTGVQALGGDASGPSALSGDGIAAFAGTNSDGAAPARAGFFVGDVLINGALSVSGTKNFKIDHPLDPQNKYLIHAAIESSEVLNLYSGNVVTDENGEAAVHLPAWFESVNRDFRYQLTVVGQFAEAIVSSKINDNRFTIRTNAPNVEVSWQVTAVRSDPAMLKRPFKAEEGKLEIERGYYLDPGAYNQPEERSIEWARHPEMMKRVKQMRDQAERKTQSPSQ